MNPEEPTPTFTRIIARLADDYPDLNIPAEEWKRRIRGLWRRCGTRFPITTIAKAADRAHTEHPKWFPTPGQFHELCLTVDASRRAREEHAKHEEYIRELEAHSPENLPPEIRQTVDEVRKGVHDFFLELDKKHAAEHQKRTGRKLRATPEQAREYVEKMEALRKGT